ncbi:sensor domain-containing protein [Phytopseudomonas flavescens]|uniref:sensor domain-containing protein n=1 Tax=Phytopseudomonas flavescens TaxID=29435 RepID=UPI0014289B1A|nr:EAL domain-containing protein [Pseudomonas flavescens]
MSAGNDCRDKAASGHVEGSRFDVDAVLAVIFELTADCILLSDAQGRLRALSQGACEAFGYGRGEMLGEPVQCLLSQVPGLPWSETGEDSGDREWCCAGIRRDGSHLPLRLRSRVLVAGKQRRCLFICDEPGECRRLSEQSRLPGLRERLAAHPDSRYATQLVDDEPRTRRQGRPLAREVANLDERAASEQAEHTRQLVTRLSQAVTRRELELHYQPQFALHSLEVSGMEALLRWRDGARGLVAPGQFIGLAIEHELMPEIGRWVIRKACEDARYLAECGLLDVGVAVNVCASLFGEADFFDFVHGTLAQTGLTADRLELEITEDEAMKSPQCIQAHARHLREAGVRLAMDDFGVGYSSLGRLRSLHFSKLKIDRSFVLRLPCSRHDEAIIRAVLSLADDLGMQVIAEGVENQRQLDCLRALGCSHGQGFWFARPMPLARLIEWLQQRRDGNETINTAP